MNFVVPSWNDRGFFTQVSLSENYVVKILGISPRILLESGMSSSVNKMILKEYLLKESWWSSLKQKAGEAVDAVSSVGAAFKKFGDNVKGVAVGLYYLSKSPDGVSNVMKTSEGMSVDALNSIGQFLEKIVEVSKEIYAAAPAQDEMQEPEGEDLSTIDKFINWTKAKREQFEDWIIGLNSGEGWKGMLSSIMGTLLAAYIKETIEETASACVKVKNKGVGAIQALVTKYFNTIKSIGTTVSTYFAAAAVAKLAGPIGWVTAAIAVFKKYKKADWILSKMKDILRNAGPTLDRPEDKPKPAA